MATINSLWTQGNPITAQRISVKKRDEVTWNNSPFDLYDNISNTLISNDFAASINNVRIENLLPNVVYDIRVENVNLGLATCNMISQYIKFICSNNHGINDLFIKNINANGFDVQIINLTNYIDKVKFYVYDSTGTTLITSSPNITTSSNQASYTFTSLSSNTTYRVYYQMISTITNNNLTYDEGSNILSSVLCYDVVTTLNSVGSLIINNNAVPGGCLTTVDVTDGVNNYQVQTTGAGTSNSIPLPFGTYDVTITKACSCNPLNDDYSCNGFNNNVGIFTGITTNVLNPDINCVAHCI